MGSNHQPLDAFLCNFYTVTVERAANCATGDVMEKLIATVEF